jgi:hypothetical protein
MKGHRMKRHQSYTPETRVTLRRLFVANELDNVYDRVYWPEKGRYLYEHAMTLADTTEQAELTRAYARVTIAFDKGRNVDSLVAEVRVFMYHVFDVLWGHEDPGFDAEFRRMYRDLVT